MKIGSLFSGAGGLDMAVEAVFGGETVWHCEMDSAASKVLAARWPDVLNLGDITTIGKHPKVGWDYIEPVEILCGGYPCQPFSAAGQRKGSADERHLWPYFAEAIRVLRPRFVVLENVAGHRSMGFDRVLADLAKARYDSQWCSVSASDVGSCHRRERVFVLAYPAEQFGTSIEARHGGLPAMDNAGIGTGGRDGSGDSPARVHELGRSAGQQSPIDLLPTPNAERVSSRMDTRLSGDGRDTPNKLGWAIAELLPTPTTQDGSNNGGPSQLDRNSVPLNALVTLLPTPAASDATGGGSHPDSRAGHTRQLIDYVLATEWGKYEPAIRRWESLTRAAPAPTEPNKNGNPRLAAAFAEWMMGWPTGWVTDVPGISRNDQLRIIGNGVVPQQATAALQWLLSVGAEVS